MSLYQVFIDESGRFEDIEDTKIIGALLIEDEEYRHTKEALRSRIRQVLNIEGDCGNVSGKTLHGDKRSRARSIIEDYLAQRANARFAYVYQTPNDLPHVELYDLSRGADLFRNMQLALVKRICYYQPNLSCENQFRFNIARRVVPATNANRRWFLDRAYPTATNPQNSLLFIVNNKDWLETSLNGFLQGAQMQGAGLPVAEVRTYADWNDPCMFAADIICNNLRDYGSQKLADGLVDHDYPSNVPKTAVLFSDRRLEEILEANWRAREANDYDKLLGLLAQYPAAGGEPPRAACLIPVRVNCEEVKAVTEDEHDAERKLKSALEVLEANVHSELPQVVEQIGSVGTWLGSRGELKLERELRIGTLHALCEVYSVNHQGGNPESQYRRARNYLEQLPKDAEWLDLDVKLRNLRCVSLHNVFGFEQSLQEVNDLLGLHEGRIKANCAALLDYRDRMLGEAYGTAGQTYAFMWRKGDEHIGMARACLSEAERHLGRNSMQSSFRCHLAADTNDNEAFFESFASPELFQTRTILDALKTELRKDAARRNNFNIWLCIKGAHTFLDDASLRSFYNELIAVSRSWHSTAHPWLLIWLSAGKAAMRLDRMDEANTFFMRGAGLAREDSFEPITDTLFVANLHAHTLQIDPDNAESRQYLRKVVDYLLQGNVPSVYLPGNDQTPVQGWFGDTIDGLRETFRGNESGFKDALKSFSSRFTFTYH